jgi:hypothetical protein
MLNVSNTVVAASLLFLSQSPAGPPAHSGNGHVILTNNTRQPIVEIYVSDDGAGYWQEDLLGPEFLLPGRSVFLDVDDRNGNCRVDVKTVLDNGSDLVKRGVNACLVDGHAISIR